MLEVYVVIIYIFKSDIGQQIGRYNAVFWKFLVSV